MASFVLPYATAGHVYVPFELAASGLFAKAADYTHVDGDTMIKKDSGAFANITTDPAAVANTGGNQASAVWDITLSATEATCSLATILTSDALLKDQCITIQFVKLPIYGTVDANSAIGSSSVTLDTATTSTVDDTYNGWMIRYTAGDGREQERIINDYVGSTHVITLNHGLTHGVTIAETDYVLVPPSAGYVTPS